MTETRIESLSRQLAQLDSAINATEIRLRDERQRRHRVEKELAAEKQKIQTQANFDQLIENGWTQEALDLIRFAYDRSNQVKKLRESSHQKRSAHNKIRWLMERGEMSDWDREYDAQRQMFTFIDRALTLLQYDGYDEKRAAKASRLYELRNELW